MWAPLVLLCFAPLLLYGFWTFDQLLKLEYTVHREQWERDGGPHGAFWTPDEAKGAGEARKFTSSLAWQRCSLVWPLKTPDWMVGDEQALLLLKRFRVIVAVWNFVGLLVFIFMGVWMKQSLSATPSSVPFLAPSLLGIV